MSCASFPRYSVLQCIAACCSVFRCVRWSHHVIKPLPHFADERQQCGNPKLIPPCRLFKIKLSVQGHWPKQKSCDRGLHRHYIPSRWNGVSPNLEVVPAKTVCAQSLVSLSLSLWPEKRRWHDKVYAKWGQYTIRNVVNVLLRRKRKSRGGERKEKRAKQKTVAALAGQSLWNTLSLRMWGWGTAWCVLACLGRPSPPLSEPAVHDSPGALIIFLVWQIFKVGLVISRKNSDSQWNPVYNAFHPIFGCGNETIRR